MALRLGSREIAALDLVAFTREDECLLAVQRLRTGLQGPAAVAAGERFRHVHRDAAQLVHQCHHLTEIDLHVVRDRHSRKLRYRADGASRAVI